MRVTKIQENEPKRKLNTPMAAVVGAVGGAAVRSLAPVTKDEYDYFVKSKEVVDLGKNVKEVAKKARPLAYFAFIGAFVAMSANVIINSLRPQNDEQAPKKEPKKSTNIDTNDVTMADILLEGLGSNTEILLLANGAEKRD